MCDSSPIKGDYAVVTTTVESADKADKLARMIVNAKLAACVQQMPIKSTYRWEGEVQVSDEVLLVSKTRNDLSQKLMRFIQDNHDYDVPELVVTPILSGGSSYLKWITDETSE